MPTTFKQVADNALSSTTTSLTSTGVTSITLPTGDGAKFALTGSFRIDLWNGAATSDPTSDANYERVTATRSGDVLTITPTTKTHTSPCNVLIPQAAADVGDLQAAVTGIETGSTVLTQVKTNSIKDPSGNNALQIATGAGTPSNFIGVGNAPSGSAPSIGPVSGGDTNVDLSLTVWGSGNVKLPADPTVPLGAATKQYVDNQATSSSIVSNEQPTGSVNGSNTLFTLASIYTTNSVQVIRNGVTLTRGVDFTETSPTAKTITFATAPNTGDTIRVNYTVSASGFSVGTNSTVSSEIPTGTVNGTTTAFTTLRGYIAGSLEVYLDGVHQRRTTDYTETTPGSGIFTMATAPLTGQTITCNYQYNLNPSSNADTVDGIHASSTATAGQLYPLNSAAKLPSSILDSAPQYSTVSTFDNVTSTTYADMVTAQSVTFTLTQTSVVEITLSAFGKKATTWARVAIVVDGAAPDDNLDTCYYGSSFTDYGVGSRTVQRTLAAGSHTVKLQSKVDAGTGSIGGRTLSIKAIG